VIAVKSAGDAALLLEITPLVLDGNAAARIAAVIRAAAVPGVIDVVPGASTVLVTFRPGEDLASELLRLAGGASPAGPQAGSPAVDPLVVDPLVIDTVYDGPDLGDVAARTGLTIAEVIARHEAAEYRVGWLGFSPGFAYLTGLDPRLAVPRLDTPRVAVPAGSVAIAGGLAAVYPAQSPGGWRLLGRTAAAVWDPDRDPPALFSPGRRVRFRAVGRLDDAQAAHFTVPERPNPDEVPAPAYLSRETSHESIEVTRPGPLTTIQDLGRPGLAHLGVPRSGAADAGSLQLANELVGNDPGAAALEVTLGRLELRFRFGALVAVAGAPAPVRLSRPGEEPARPGPAHETAFTVPAGSVLRLGAPAAGLRSYLAIGGGIDVTPVLGSRSTDILSGLGPRPLRPGEVLPVARARSRHDRGNAPQPRGAGRRVATDLPASAGAAAATVLRVIPGPRDDWFAAAALGTLAGSDYEVTAASNRSGLRLAGPPLRRTRTEELPSEGMAAGALQVSHDGQPILLLADHPATGGYPVIGVVVTADLDVAAQLRPGQRVTFRLRPDRAQPASSR